MAWLNSNDAFKDQREIKLNVRANLEEKSPIIESALGHFPLLFIIIHDILVLHLRTRTHLN